MIDPLLDSDVFEIERRRHILRSTTEKRIHLDSDLSNMLNIKCQGMVYSAVGCPPAFMDGRCGGFDFRILYLSVFSGRQCSRKRVPTRSNRCLRLVSIMLFTSVP
jgi:hypothetical protein